MILIDWLISWIKKKPCTHQMNYHDYSWLSKDGTPMTRFVCNDCGFIDFGHVHADPSNWEAKTIVVENGKIINSN